MAFLNLKRLLPSRKLWKLLKNKLPLKLHKLRKSKTKKNPPQKPSSKATRKTGRPSPLSLRPTKFKTIHRDRHKSSKPVFIDQLFPEPVSGVCIPVEAQASGKSGKSAVGGDQSMTSADDMWESMVLASPHIHGIDERAEEFIARIKAERRLQG